MAEAKVIYDGAPRPELAATPVDAQPVAAAEFNPWDCPGHEWRELYRYFGFLQADPETGEPVAHDTAEPPRGEPDPKTGVGPRLRRYTGDSFGERQTATHYQATAPPDEIVFKCDRCWHTVAVRVPAALSRKLEERVETGQLQVPHFSHLGHEELLGQSLHPGDVKVEAPKLPDWIDEQRAMIRRIAAGLPAVAE